RFERRLVPARERAPRVRRLELGGGHKVRGAARVLVARAVEAAKLVVQAAGEGEGEPPTTGCKPRRERDAAALRRLVHGRHAAQGLAAVILDRRLGDRQLDRVEDDLVGRLGDGERDGLLATEGERRQVGLEPEVVAARYHVTRQTIWVHSEIGRASGRERVG